MMNAINELVEISKYAGMREDLVQAGGGNSSVKLDSNQMVIKASGVQLAEVSQEKGYSTVNYPLIEQIMDKLINGEMVGTEKEILEAALIKGNRPSIETFLHAVTGRVTLHTHSVAIDILTTRTEGMKILQKLFPKAIFINYATPGLRLAKLYYKTYLEACKGEKQEIPMIFLKNHGMIISGNTAGDVIQTTEEVTLKVERVIGMDNERYRQAYKLYKKFLEYGFKDDKIVVCIENKGVLDAYKTFNKLLWDYQICPDTIVFCGKEVFICSDLNNKGDLNDFIERNGEPVIIKYHDELFVRAESVKKAREIESVFAFSAQIALYNKGYTSDLLSKEEQNFLIDWDAEKYRQRMK